MKKIVFILAMAVCALTAQAATYAYLVFTNTGGTTTAIRVSNLTLTVSGTELQVTNDDGTVSFTLTDLASMQFSADGTAALENVLNADAPVEVYSVTGKKLGSYESLLKAASSLDKGVYVISDGTNSQTIVVK